VSRPYHQFCGVAKALDLVGERWTLLVVRDLLLGPRRFGELASALVGISPALLTTRLVGLVEHGLVERTGSGRGQRYCLTAQGRALEPVVLALGRFGAQYLGRPGDDDHLNVRWAMVSLKRRYRGCAHPWRLELDVGGALFALVLGPRLDVRDGALPDADARVSGSPMQVGALLTGRMDVAQAMDAGLTVGGEPLALRALWDALDPPLYSMSSAPT